ncbi:Bug family tripartite tricarboxylate transporter substrate binding protein [Propionivibrio dicarboxylicus]|uniref:Tripartite-type tricarboxylate transporter, receptor component TctC n=1 Tax=Propionivibrio dicarboxylicus TaxID=83767 RepID=A0A1G7YHC5_9RHOO|nr:tripartite tricarboxylate transporter substrate binding protein [Propionivibrio dicarboxylicus]SDG95941.1 Tripartite-type tricarboxylate transporter, receptor component TctC [Propionivibrio dicarboxylicus]
MKSLCIAMSICGLLTTPAAFAQDPAFPSKTVTMVVPFPPGGGTDTGARWVAQKLSEKWGQSVVVDNKPGASGTIGADYVARAKPDGYTIMMANAQTVAINPGLLKKIPYNTEKAFAPISLVAELPLVLLVNSEVTAKTTKEFIALAKQDPGELTYGSAGNGSSTHLAASLFEDATGTKLMHVPYKGGGPAMQDVMAGHIKLTLLTVLESASALKSGKVRPVAVTSDKRSPALPEVPTLAESGVPGYFSISWIGLLAPAGTPPEIVEKIAKDVQQVVNAPEMRDRLVGQGATPVGGSPAQFKAFIDSETQRYRKLIADKGIVAD